MCLSTDGCFRFGRFTVTWDRVVMAWALYDGDTFRKNFKTLADAKKFALGRS